jgi:hypothetical protein
VQPHRPLDVQRFDPLQPLAGSQLDAFGGEGLGDGGGRFRLLPGQEPVERLDHGDVGTEAAEGLGQFAANGASAEDGQRPRQVGEFEDVLVGEMVDAGEAVDGGHGRLGAGGNHEAAGPEDRPIDVELVRGAEGGPAVEDVDGR